MAGCNSSHCSENMHMILDSHLKKTLSNQMHPYLTRRGDLSSSVFFLFLFFYFLITKIFLVEKTCSTFSLGEKKIPLQILSNEDMPT